MHEPAELLFIEHGSHFAEMLALHLCQANMRPANSAGEFINFPVIRIFSYRFEGQIAPHIPEINPDRAAVPEKVLPQFDHFPFLTIAQVQHLFD